MSGDSAGNEPTDNLDHQALAFTGDEEVDLREMRLPPAAIARRMEKPARKRADGSAQRSCWIWVRPILHVAAPMRRLHCRMVV